MIKVGIDTGGTFTDAVSTGPDGELRVHKVPTTLERPSVAVLQALAFFADESAVELVHGTTHATNALLTQQLGRVVFVTTRGFADVLAIGRQERDRLYALEPRAARPRIAQRLVVEVDERLDAEGRVVKHLSRDEVAKIVERVRRLRPQAIAVGFLHAYREPIHEQRMARALRRLKVPVFLSSEVAPEYREFERFTTTWANAALEPVVAPALRELSRLVGERFPGSAAVRILRSDGGTATAEAAAQDPVHLALSGPAGGFAAARSLADARGDGHVLTLDMGGTSTDVALLPPGEPELRGMELGGLPLLARGLPVHSVGTGGGSLARWDPGGALTVGPESAGAVPGPVCYGRGGVEPTVTDAHLLAGRLHPEAFLGGEFALELEAAEAALAELGARVGMGAKESAQAILEIASADMERALRRVSLAQGHDPRDFHLFAFGGAGGLHAAWVASRLGMRSVVIPPLAGAFSAVGMLSAPARRTFARTVLTPVPSQKERQILFKEMEERAKVELVAEGVEPGAVRFWRVLELRSEGQGAEFAIPEGPNLLERFHQAHEQRFGYRRSDVSVVLVTARLRAEGLAGKAWRAREVRPCEAVPFEKRPTFFPEHGSQAEEIAAWYWREELTPGAHLVGPAVVAEYSGTTVVPRFWTAQVDEFGALVLQHNPPQDA